LIKLRAALRKFEDQARRRQRREAIIPDGGRGLADTKPILAPVRAARGGFYASSAESAPRLRCRNLASVRQAGKACNRREKDIYR
jgi:hypothetical protein